MEVRDLPLPDPVRAHYRDAGISSLYPTQSAAVEAGLLEGRSVLAAVPTASGKTLIAELAMHAAVERGGRAIYIVPLRALATEKHEAFAALPGLDVGVATGDYDAPAADLADHDVVIATSEKVDSLIRNGADWLREVTCAVVDEIHLLDDTARGPTLEVTIAKLRRMSPDVQFVGLSATVANADAIADWLDAAPVESDWRPVDLRIGVFDNGDVRFPAGDARAVPGAADDPTGALVGETVAEEAQVLVFVHSRRAAERLADRLGPVGFGGPETLEDEIRETATTDTGERLATAVAGGAAFHHAGLRQEHRLAVEQAFRTGELAVVCATPTLAAGVNLPARRVVVRDLDRYTDRGREALGVNEVRQMCGRAGRPDLDPRGEAVLVPGERDPEAVLDAYVRADPAPVTSSLASQDALRTHVLATVASGFADSRESLLEVLAGTFYAHAASPGGLRDVMDLVLDFLASEGFLETADGLVATELGDRVSRLYVDPRSAAQIRDGLRAAAERPDAGPITVLELICRTPDLGTLYVRDPDHARLVRFAEAHDGALLGADWADDGEYADWLAALKTACVLHEWAADVPEDSIADRYGVGPGDLRATRERAQWLLSATESIAEWLGTDPSLVDELTATRRALESREG